MDTTTAHSNQIYIYPIKSGPPVRKRKLEWEDGCLQFDRHWLIVKPTGEMVTLRSFPQLNTLVMEEKESSFVLRTSNSDFSPIEFPKQDDGFGNLSVEIWGQHIQAILTQKELGQWISEFLNEKIHILHHPDRIKTFKKSSGDIHMKLHFQDGYPVHIVNTSSLHWLKEASKKQLHPLQFRANIYIDLKKAFAEDHLEQITINGQAFQKIKECDRCIVINLHHGSDVFYKEPLATLSTWRRHGNHIYFGFYAKPLF